MLSGQTYGSRPVLEACPPFRLDPTVLLARFGTLIASAFSTPFPAVEFLSPARCGSLSTLFLTCGPSARLDKKQKCRAYQRWLSIMVLGTLLT